VQCGDTVRYTRHAASECAQSREGDGQCHGAVSRDQHVERDTAADRGYRAPGGCGSANPAGILATTLFATFCSTGVAIILAKLCERWWPMPLGDVASDGAGRIAPADRTQAGGEPSSPTTRRQWRLRKAIQCGHRAWHFARSS
jgi:hypothetical protein